MLDVRIKNVLNVNVFIWTLMFLAIERLIFINMPLSYFQIYMFQTENSLHYTNVDRQLSFLLESQFYVLCVFLNVR